MMLSRDVSGAAFNGVSVVTGANTISCIIVIACNTLSCLADRWPGEVLYAFFHWLLFDTPTGSLCHDQIMNWLQGSDNDRGANALIIFDE
jgi:hypothetical protein